MTAHITPVSKMLTLVKREFQEQRILFLYLPLMILLLTSVVFAATAIRSYLLNIQYVGLIGARIPAEGRDAVAEALLGFASLPVDIKIRFWEQFYSQAMPILYISFWGAIFYYFQMTLFAQRRDRSILFWNSLPVNDRETIFSKLIAGFVLCYAVYLVSLFVLQVMMLVIMSLYTAMFDIGIWDNVMAPSGIFGRFGNILMFSFLSIFWCLPVYAWLLLTSAWAKSAPFAWAMAPLVVMLLFEFLFVDSDLHVLRIFFEHAFPVDLTGIGGPGSDYAARGVLLSGEMLISILLGIAFIAGAIHLNRSEDV